MCIYCDKTYKCSNCGNVFLGEEGLDEVCAEDYSDCWWIWECPKCRFGVDIENDEVKEEENLMKREEVYKIIDSERDYQDKKWNPSTTTSNGKHSWEEWFMYIEDYVNEAKHSLSRMPKQDADRKASDVMRKVAAMAVCSMEQLGSQRR